MKNKQKGSVGVILLIITVVILIGVIGWMYLKQPAQTTLVSDNSQATNSQNTVQNSNTTNTVPINTTKKVNDVSLSQIENATYQVADLTTMHGTERVTLINGKGNDGNVDEPLYAQIIDRDVIFGDLNNDGAKDAAGFLFTSKGGAKNGTQEYQLEMIVNNSGAINTYRCSLLKNDFSVTDYQIKNGLVIDSNQNDIYPVGNLRGAYKFDGTKCVSGDIDITTGKANF